MSGSKLIVPGILASASGERAGSRRLELWGDWSCSRVMFIRVSFCLDLAYSGISLEVLRFI